MSLRVLASLVSGRPCFGMGTHLASFQAGGNEPCRRRLVDKLGRRSGVARCIALTMAHEIPSVPMAESRRHNAMAFAVSPCETGIQLLLISWRGSGSQLAGRGGGLTTLAGNHAYRSTSHFHWNVLAPLMTVSTATAFFLLDMCRTFPTFPRSAWARVSSQCVYWAFLNAFVQDRVAILTLTLPLLLLGSPWDFHLTSDISFFRRLSSGVHHLLDIRDGFDHGTALSMASWMWVLICSAVSRVDPLVSQALSLMRRSLVTLSKMTHLVFWYILLGVYWGWGEIFSAVAVVAWSVSPPDPG